MHRLNSEGWPRHELPYVLTQARIVREAVKFDSCLLCRGGRVQPCGLCENCFSQLTSEENLLAEQWSASGPPDA